MRPAVSGGMFQAGRVLERVYKRLEQKAHHEMGEDPSFRRARVFSGRPVEADQALQSLEGKFDAPAEPIEIKYLPRRDRVCAE
jgi:hypothetical protein